MFARVKSKAKMSHSYTVLPIIDANGKLYSPLFVVMKETNGVFGPLVQESLFKADNIHAIAARSSIMGTKELDVWLRNVLVPHAPDEAILMIDSWPTYKNKELLKSVLPVNRSLEIVTVPPRATGICQPLDIFFFRMYKDFVRKIWDYVVREKLNVQLQHRNSVLKLQSLTHNQFSCTRFQEMWKIGWKHPGYLEAGEHYDGLTPSQYCFRSEAHKNREKCCRSPCLQTHFISCAWCRLTLCFTHFYVDYHFCTYIADPVFTQ